MYCARASIAQQSVQETLPRLLEIIIQRKGQAAHSDPLAYRSIQRRTQRVPAGG